jgi:hypothetical protein
MTSKICPFCEKEMIDGIKKDLPVLICKDCDESFIDEGRMNKTPKKRYHPGGLLRCCIKTLEESDVQEIKGEKLVCMYCKDTMFFDGQIWRWKSNDLVHLGDPDEHIPDEELGY